MSGLRATVAWYLGHRDWCDQIQSGAYREWPERNYEHRGAA
jgi:dTDP-glucose 4,6-dehydratase